MHVYKLLKDWLEVWALIIPITVLLFKPKQPFVHRPIIIYLFLALVFNTAANIIWKTSYLYELPKWLESNNYIYNLHAVVRFYLFAWFFTLIDRKTYPIVKKLIPLLFTLFLIINFIWAEDFFFFDKLSNRLHAVEAGLLLIYSLMFYWSKLQFEHISITKSEGFWVVTGLAIFVLTSFPIYLYYELSLRENIETAIDLWQVQKVAFLLFCIFIAKAFYDMDSKQRHAIITNS